MSNCRNESFRFSFVWPRDGRRHCGRPVDKRENGEHLPYPHHGKNGADVEQQFDLLRAQEQGDRLMLVCCNWRD